MKPGLSRAIASNSRDAIFLDLEREADRAQLARADLFFPRHRDQLVVLDEVQTIPDLFAKLRPEIDADRRAGRFLLLDSASGSLLRQSAESLAGPIAYLELTPFLLEEIGSSVDANSTTQAASLWLRGGFPRSFLASAAAESLAWRTDFIETFLARDLPQLGITLETAVEMAGHAGRLVPQQFRETCAKCRAVEPKSLRSLWHKAFHLPPPVNCCF